MAELVKPALWKKLQRDNDRIQSLLSPWTRAYSQRRQSASDKHDRSLALPGHDLFLKNPLLLMAGGNGDILNREKYQQFSHLVTKSQQSYSRLFLPLIRWQRGAYSWSELERIFPAQKGRNQINEPARPGELRRGSVIQKFEKPPAPTGMESSKFDRVPAREKEKSIPQKSGMADTKGRIFTRVTEITPYQQQIQPEGQTPATENIEPGDIAGLNYEPNQAGPQFTGKDNPPGLYITSPEVAETGEELLGLTFTPAASEMDLGNTSPDEDGKASPTSINGKAAEQASDAINQNVATAGTINQGMPLIPGRAEKGSAVKAGQTQPAVHTVQRMPDKKSPENKPPATGKSPPKAAIPGKPEESARLRVAQPDRTEKVDHQESPAEVIYAKPVTQQDNTGESSLGLPLPGDTPEMIHTAPPEAGDQDRVAETSMPIMPEEQFFAPGEEVTGTDVNMTTSYPALDSGKPVTGKVLPRHPGRTQDQTGWDSPKKMVLHRLPAIDGKVFTGPQETPSEPETRSIAQQWSAQNPEVGHSISRLPVSPDSLLPGAEKKATAVIQADYFAVGPVYRPIEASLPVRSKTAGYVQRENDGEALPEPKEEHEDLDQLAEKVLPYVKRLIEIERERAFGR